MCQCTPNIKTMFCGKFGCQPVTALDIALLDSAQGLLVSVSPPHKTAMQSKLTRDLREVGMSVHDFI